MVRKAIEQTTEKVLDLFQKKYLMKFAYYAGGNNTRYHDETGEPTWEFYKAWDWTPIRKKINSLVTELWYDSSDVNYEPVGFAHGSKYSNPHDVSENLPAILEGKQSRLWMSVPRRGKFWQEFIADMFDGGKLDKMLRAELKAAGLTIT